MSFEIASTFPSEIFWKSVNLGYTITVQFAVISKKLIRLEYKLKVAN